MLSIQQDGTILGEDARLIFKNFAGAPTQYNTTGKREFSLDLRRELDFADILIKEGWNVKQKPARSDEELPLVHLPVEVRFGKRPPSIFLITSKGRRKISEEQIMLIDHAEIDNVDLIIRPYNWGPIRGESGRKAYLKELFVTLRESVLDMKYADLPDISLNPDIEDPDEDY